MTFELKQALRSLRRTPGFLLVTALTLGVGIGANAAMLGLFDVLLLRPPAGVQAPERLVRFELERPAIPGAPATGLDASVSWPQFEALRATAGADLESVAAWAAGTLPVGSPGSSRDEQVILASGEYFQVLGAGTLIGQRIGEEHDVYGSPLPVAVLSHDYWRRAYGGDPGVIGREITIGGAPLTIIGVAQRGFVGTRLGAPAAWVPLALAGSLGYEPEMMRSPFVSWLTTVGRLNPSGEPARVEAAAQAALLAAAESGAAAPTPIRSTSGRIPGGRVQITTGGGEAGGAAPAPEVPRVRLGRIGGPEGPSGGTPVQLWYLAATAAILLIACANVANLLLARGAHRAQDLAIRAALGAGPARIGRFLLSEAILLAVAGSVAALAVALFAWRLLPTLVELPPLPPFVGLRTLAIVGAIAIGTVFLFGLVPLARLSRPDVARLLGGASARTTRATGGRSALVVAQFALSVVLLVAAALFIRSFQEVQGANLGYQRQGLLLVSVTPQGNDWTPDRAAEFWRESRERLAALPQVRSVSLATNIPYAMRMMMPLVGDVGRDAPPDAAEAVLVNFVDADFFQTLGVQMREGRAFTPDDRDGGPAVAVVSESFARDQFDGASPIGRCLTMPGGAGACIEVVGVSADTRFGEITEESPRSVYRPLDQRMAAAIPPSVLHVRTDGDAAALASAIPGILDTGGAEVRLQVRSIAELIAPQLAPWRGSATLLSMFGVVAAALAAIGLYGVVSFLVARRTREIGVRLALGAARSSVMGMVLRDAGRLVLAGAAIGLVGALFAARMLGSLLHGVGPFDPAAFASAAMLLALVGVAAAALPARRASAVDPITALRQE